MNGIEFLILQDVVFAHSDQISRYGGDPGTRDSGLLELAIAQAQAIFGGQYLHDIPFGMVAAYLFHFVKNHPFVDGNKRSGAVAALLFLDLNNIKISAPSGSVYKLTIDVANGLSGKDEIASFFRTHAVAR